MRSKSFIYSLEIGIPSGVRLQELKVASSKTRKSNAVQNPHFVDVLRGVSFLELSNRENLE